MSSVHSAAQIKCNFSNDEFKFVIRALTGSLRESEIDEAHKLGSRLMAQLIKAETQRLEILKGALGHIDDDVDDGGIPLPEVTYLRPGSGLGGYGGPTKSKDLADGSSARTRTGMPEGHRI